MLIVSILLPVIWHWISRSYFAEKVLNKIGFNTTLEDTVWDYIQYRDKEKKGIVLKDIEDMSRKMEDIFQSRIIIMIIPDGF